MKTLISILLLTVASSAFAANTYFGSSIGYLTDSKEEFYSARIGTDFAKVNAFTHAFEGEVGISRDHEAGFTFEIVPVMANYRFTAKISQTKLGVYAGAGAGVSRLKITGWGYDDSNWSFTAQAVVGVEYNVTPTFAVTAGGRYIWIDDVSLLGANLDVGDDFGVEVGVRFRF